MLTISKGGTGSAGIACRMAPEIMRADFDADLFSGFFDNLPGAGVADRENSLLKNIVLRSAAAAGVEILGRR